MYRDGHYGLTLSLYAPVGFVLVWIGATRFALLSYMGVVVLSSFPDIDLKTSYLKHRGVSHSIVAAAAVGVVYAAVAVGLNRPGILTVAPLSGLLEAVAVAGFGFVIGVFGIGSHILGDLLTPMGVSPLLPFSSKTYSLNVTTAASERANYILFNLGVLGFFAAFVGPKILRSGLLSRLLSYLPFF